MEVQQDTMYRDLEILPNYFWSFKREHGVEWDTRHLLFKAVIKEEIAT
jgi:hypothetical protein